MEKLKQFMSGLLHTLVLVLTIMIVITLVFVMIAWTVGMVYIATEAGCSVEDGRLMCELASEVGKK